MLNYSASAQTPGHMLAGGFLGTFSRLLPFSPRPPEAAFQVLCKDSQDGFLSSMGPPGQSDRAWAETTSLGLCQLPSLALCCSQLCLHKLGPPQLLSLACTPNSEHMRSRHHPRAPTNKERGGQDYPDSLPLSISGVPSIALGVGGGDPKRGPFTPHSHLSEGSLPSAPPEFGFFSHWFRDT